MQMEKVCNCKKLYGRLKTVSLRKKGAGRGVSLRRFSILMLFVSLVIMVILLVTTFRTGKSWINAWKTVSGICP